MGLSDDVSQTRTQSELPQFITNRCYPLLSLQLCQRLKFAPKRHQTHFIFDLADNFPAKGAVRKQRLQPQQRSSVYLCECQKRSGQNVLSAHTPAIRPYLPKNGEHSVGNQGFVSVTGKSQRVKADRDAIGWVDNYHITSPIFWNSGQDIVDEVCFGIKNQDTPARLDIRKNQVLHYGTFAAAGWADDVGMFQ